MIKKPINVTLEIGDVATLESLLYVQQLLEHDQRALTQSDGDIKALIRILSKLDTLLVDQDGVKENFRGQGEDMGVLSGLLGNLKMKIPQPWVE